MAPPVRLPLERLLVWVDSELMANVVTITVGIDGKGIVELAGGSEKFGRVELAVDEDVFLAHRKVLEMRGGSHV